MTLTAGAVAMPALGLTALVLGHLRPPCPRPDPRRPRGDLLARHHLRRGCAAVPPPYQGVRGKDAGGETFTGLTPASYFYV